MLIQRKLLIIPVVLGIVVSCILMTVGSMCKQHLVPYALACAAGSTCYSLSLVYLDSLANIVDRKNLIFRLIFAILLTLSVVYLILAFMKKDSQRKDKCVYIALFHLCIRRSIDICKTHKQVWNTVAISYL